MSDDAEHKAVKNIEELTALLKERLRTTVEAALKSATDRIGQATDIAALVNGIDALKRAKKKGYLVDPSDQVDAAAERLRKQGAEIGERYKIKPSGPDTAV